MTEAGPTPPHFDAVLYPHRSLSTRGFHILIVAVGAVSLCMGVAFALRGAWPIFGFFGLDVLALYVAFRLSYRSGRLREVLQLFDQALVLRRIHPNGRTRRWSFHPHWVRVVLNADRHGHGDITLASHGRQVAFGSFLSEQERGELAEALKAALRRFRGSGAHA